MHSRIFLASAITLGLAVTGAGCSPDQPPPMPETGTANTTAAPQPAVTADLGQSTDTAATGAGISTVAGGDLIIEISASGIVIMASGVSQEAILQDLARREGFELVTAGVAWESVDQTIQAVNLHTALVELLKAHPYQIIYEYDPDRQADTLTRVLVGEPDALRESLQAGAARDIVITSDILGDGLLPGSAEASLPEEERIYLQQLLDPSPEVREEAANSIDPKGIALDYLATIVTSDPSPEVRIAAAYTLEDSKAPKAMDALIMALQDQNPEVLVEVIDALAYQENQLAIPYLTPFLGHPDEDVRDAAENALDDLN